MIQMESMLNVADNSLLEITQGKTLILFTSYDSLQKTCEYVREHIDEKIKILKQGEADRMQLLYEFKERRLPSRSRW